MITRISLSKRMAILVIAIVLVAGAILFSRRIEGAGAATGDLLASTPPALTAAAAQEKGQGELIRTIRVFIHPDDIYPSGVVVKPGKIRLTAENETLSDIALIVERVNPGQARQSVAALRTVNQGKRIRQELTLGAGEYIFYEESRPQQQGRIIVKPQDR